ncbi:MAG TPA: universal stress protein [Pseudomonadales bacterium]|jgi:nucleotide-binding universal stress UspA family protein|nr:universal stress protein [Pseudomonadales bacterium]
MTQIYGRILVPVDGSPTSDKGLQEAIKIAKALGSTLRIVHVVDELVVDYSGIGGTNYYYSGDIIEGLREGGKKVLANAEAVVRKGGLEPEAVLLEAIGGPSSRLIVAQAQEWPADLIVMGTHGRRGIRRLALGSDAEHVLRASPAPVLLVRSAPE